ncbi:hypothetical protein ASA1KI_28490 [Opitutales bacterium ASA1]|uniref:AraC family transcriptional regulator n=1 Tax=Congregicoccus parvus TaxID=3081749 RepID=UPI002B2C3DBE|nr:hypothetical protein ASA1KI_28490 [Opitutales bacterium ASA1]
MPHVIRQAIADRLRRLPEMERFLADFRTATGVGVEFVGPLGQREVTEAFASQHPLCAAVRKQNLGCRFCSAGVQEVLERAGTSSFGRTCDAGMCEHAVPLRAGGQTFGWLLFGGHFPSRPETGERNRIRHLLDRVGVPIAPETLEELCRRTPVISPEKHAALVRLLESAARSLVAVITEHLAPANEAVSPIVRRACDYAHANFVHEMPMRDVAAVCGVSVPHLCRVFHQATGLRFRDYLGRLRVAHARELLLGTDRPITEIAFASGFQTLSQFNRVYRKVHGCAPRETRRSDTLTPAAPASKRSRSSRPSTAPLGSG